MDTRTLDVTREHCPMTFVKTKIELSKLKEGEVLQVIVCEGEALDNIPGAARDQGYTVLSVSETQNKGQHQITISK